VDANVDKMYHLSERMAARTLEAITLAGTPREQNVGGIAGAPVDSGHNAVAPGLAHVKPPPSALHHPERQVSGSLTRIVADFPLPLSFEPEDEKEPLGLQRLPDEILVHILSYLSTSAVEHFARVSRKARVITLDATIWRSDFSPPSPVSSVDHSYPSNLLATNGLFRTLSSRRDGTVLISHLIQGIRRDHIQATADLTKRGSRRHRRQVLIRLSPRVHRAATGAT
jgi:F-box-like